MIDAFRIADFRRRVSLVACPTAVLLFGGSLAGQSSPACRDLVADRSRPVGTVCVSVSEADVEIVIAPTSQFLLFESRVAVASELEGFPLSEASAPRLGLYPYVEEHHPPTERASYRIPISTLDLRSGELLMSVHASVLDELQEEHGAWAVGTRFRPEGMPATYFVVQIKE